MNRNFLISMLIMVFFSCHSTKKVVTRGDYVIFTFRKTECRGKCPVYSMEILKSGMVNYEGISNVNKIGRYSKQITSKEVDELVTGFKRVDFFSLQDEYTASITDLPSTYISFTDKGRTKTIRDYHGAPEILTDLERKLETIANSDAGWMKIE